MNIEKEKKNHTEWFKGDDPVAFSLVSSSQEYERDFLLSERTWLAAKAQAVPKYHMENIRDALVIACDIKEDKGRFEDSLNYIHQAMIEAQE